MRNYYDDDRDGSFVAIAAMLQQCEDEENVRDYVYSGCDSDNSDKNNALLVTMVMLLVVTMTINKGNVYT